MAHYKKNKTKSDASKGKAKVSGARIESHIDSDKGLFIPFWKVHDGVLWNCKIVMSDNDVKKGIVISKTQKEWVSVTVFCSAPFKPTITLKAIHNTKNSKTYINEWNFIVNPKAPNGGYAGKHISKNYD
ncbi:hypothetical protein [Tenacibaculum ovolyticum]|uniref:hypothetical protein n=1 Tax=Tenacibaculum ovolyticum TaxID=104270 RepID=UPI001F1F8E71|nr:hypothetical protein [Tenacibaculum ovolyticum]